jgi:hypothetical protein
MEMSGGGGGGRTESGRMGGRFAGNVKVGNFDAFALEEAAELRSAARSTEGSSDALATGSG